MRISFGEVPASATLPHVSSAQSQGAGKETDGDHRLPCTLTSLARRGSGGEKKEVQGDIRLSIAVTVFTRNDNAKMRWTPSAQQMRS